MDTDDAQARFGQAMTDVMDAARRALAALTEVFQEISAYISEAVQPLLRCYAALFGPGAPLRWMLVDQGIIAPRLTRALHWHTRPWRVLRC